MGASRRKWELTVEIAVNGRKWELAVGNGSWR